MSEADKDSTYSARSRFPMFSGEADDWIFYRKKMESYLARNDLSDLLDESIGGTVTKDDYKFPMGSAKAAPDEKVAYLAKKTAGEKLRKDNCKASGILVDSISLLTEKGKAAFFVVDKFHTAKGNFRGGQFYKSWEAL